MSEAVDAMPVLPDPGREQPLTLGGDDTSPATRELFETLDAADAYRAAGVPMPAEPELPAQPADVVPR